MRKRLYTMLAGLLMAAMGQAQIATFPVTWTFENDMAGWTAVSNDDFSEDDWMLHHDGSDDIYSIRAIARGYTDEGMPIFYPADEWLISPAISVTSEGLAFEYWMTNYRDSISVYVTNDNEPEFIMLADPVFDTACGSGGSMRQQVKRTIPLSDYYDQVVYIAIRFMANGTNMWGNTRFVKGVVREMYHPTVALPGDTIVDINTAVKLKAMLTEGLYSGLGYTWSSQMADMGQADMESDYDSVTMTYTSTGIDTIVVMAQNTYGYAYDTVVVRVVDMQAGETPYDCTFEAVDHHWLFFNGENGWYAGSVYGYDGGNALYISGDGGTNNTYTGTPSVSYAVRALDLEESGIYQYSFRWRCMGRGEMVDYMKVAFTKDLKNLDADRMIDMSGMQGAPLCSSSMDWQTQSGLASLDSGRVYMVLVWRNLEVNSHYGTPVPPAAAIDDIHLRIATCLPPEDFRVTAATDSSITIAWTAMNNETNWAYSLDGSPYITIQQNPYTIYGTTDGVEHTISLHSACTISDTSVDVTTTVLTPCRAIDELPWSEGFDDFLPYEALFSNCWGRGRVDGLAPSQAQYVNMPYARSVDNNNVLYMQGHRQVGFIDNGYSYVVLPRMAEPLNTLGISFEMRRAADGEARVVVGIISGTYYDATVAIDTVAAFEATGNDWQTFNASMAGHSVQPDERIIIITDLTIDTSVTNMTHSSIYIDNIDVYDGQSCLRPTHLTAEVVSETYAYITWQHVVEGMEHFYLSYRADGYGDWESYDVYESEAWLQNLEEGTMYEVMVETRCDGGSTSSNAATLTFRTLCHVDADAYYVEDFEGESAECWQVLVGNRIENIAWHNTTDMAYEGSHSMMSGYCLQYFGPIDEWLISPAILVPDGADEALSFMWYGLNPSSTSTGTLREEPYLVLVNSTGGSFSEKSLYTDTLAYISGDNVWTKHTATISQYAGEKIYIAFVHNVCSNITDNGVYIDSVALGIVQVPVPAIGGNTMVNMGYAEHYHATLTEGNGVGLTYQWASAMLQRGEATGGVDVDDSSLLALTYLAEGIDTITLTASNQYGATTDTLLVTVRDLHVISTLPYHTGFEATDDNEAWSVANSATLGWYVGEAEVSEGQQALYVSADDGNNNEYNITANTIYVYRGLEISEAGEYIVSFDWHAGGLATNGNVHGAMYAALVPATTTFEAGTPLNYIDAVRLRQNNNTAFNGSNEWVGYNGILDLESGLYILVFCWNNVAGGSAVNPAAAIDNLSIEQLTCYPPTDMTLISASSTSATVTWAVGGAQAWEVSVDGGTPVVVQQYSYTATGLMPSSQHTVSVRSICGVGDTSRPAQITFMTDCAVVEDMPWTEDFNSYAPSATGVEVNCWAFLGGGRVLSTRQQSLTGGSNDISIRPVHQSNRDTIALVMALPSFYFPTQYLELSFYLLANGNNAGLLEVGYLGSGNDITSFVPVRTISPTEAMNTFTPFSVTFPQATGNERLAFRKTYGNEYGTMYSDSWFLDEVMVDTIAGSNPLGCDVPGGMTATHIQGTLYRVDWTAGGSESTWVLQREHNGDTLTATVNNTPRRIYNDLVVGDTYHFRIKAVCNALASSDWSDEFTLVVEADTTSHEGIAAGQDAAVSWALYPNPASGSVTVDLTGLSSGITVDIMDLNGRTLESCANADGACTLDLSSYSRGTYFVRVTTVQGTSVKKLTLVR